MAAHPVFSSVVLASLDLTVASQVFVRFLLLRVSNSTPSPSIKPRHSRLLIFNSNFSPTIPSSFSLSSLLEKSSKSLSLYRSMPNRSLFLLLSLIAVAATAASAALGGGGRVGGYEPIKNLNDQHLVEIAQFAVDQYNKQNGAHLQLVKIVKAEQQVVSGMNYRLVIEAKNGGAGGNYEAIVYEKPWQKIRQLTSFKPL